MKMRNIVLSLGLLAVGFGIAQGPLYDRIIVNLPYPVTVNGTVLQPGEYEIRQHESIAGGSRIVHFYTDQGMKFETTAMGIPALENRTQEETRLILDHIGQDYYLSKIWVQGRDYGYEFPIPESVRLREKEANVSASIVGRYEPAAAPPAVAETQTTQTQTTTTETRTEIAQSAPPPAPPVVAEPAPAPVEQIQPAPAPAPQAATPAPEYADRATDTMPATAGNWLSLLLGGGLVTSFGLVVRRIRM